MNNQLIPVPSTLLRNKLAIVAQRLQQQALPDGAKVEYATLEQAVSAAIGIVSNFYKYLSQPSFQPEAVKANDLPDPTKFNRDFQSITDDLSVIFAEFENMEGVVLGSFNYMASRINRLNRKLKEVSGALADYILYSDQPTKDAFFFSDTFNNLQRVEVNSPLINTEQAEINQVEGIATLPINREAQVPLTITELPVVNSNSNGRVGNNEEAGALLHGNIQDILDNNADTWFEYERVNTYDDGEALVLDFTVNLSKAKVVNFIRINPNNFGTRTQVEVLSIDTSLDGRSYISIKDDIPISDFAIEDEENVFTLAPSTSKYAGQGLYTFTPRKAKYIHFTLKQGTPYSILTSSGTEKLRWAIGIRDIEIQAQPYKTDGEIISVEYVSLDEISKIALESNQNPSAGTTSKLASIKHYISPDNGTSWYQIRPKASIGISAAEQEVPEIITFNSVGAGAVSTATPVYRLRYKAVLNRDATSFQDGAEGLAETVVGTTELFIPPTTSPFTLSLANPPVEGSISIIDPSFGSRGFDDGHYGIATGKGVSQIVRLPFAPLKKDYVKTYSGGIYYLDEQDPETIYVNGKAWTRGALTGTNENYKLDYEEGTIEFGDGTNGAEVPDGTLISMKLDEERLFFNKGIEHLAALDYATAKDKGQIVLTIYKPLTLHTMQLKQGAKVHKLLPNMYPSIAPKFSDNSVFANIQSTEEAVDSTGDYYIDYTNGKIIAYDRTSTTTNTTVSFHYYPTIVLKDSDWEFGEDKDGKVIIKISDNAFQSFSSDTENVPASVNYFNLGNLSIIPGSVVFTGDSGDTLSKEVAYVDGRSELLEMVKTTQKIAALTYTASSGEQIVSFPLKTRIATDTNFSVDFSNQTVFDPDEEQPTMADLIVKLALGTVGAYFVDRSGGTNGMVYVIIDSDVSEPGYVSYYFTNPQANLTGRFSINYQTGEVFSYTATGSGITVNYDYTDIRIKYYIARAVLASDWEYDSTTNQILIADREIKKSGRAFQVANPNASSEQRHYQVSYNYVQKDRAKVSELEPYFSPVLKDYAIKVINKARLI